MSQATLSVYSILLSLEWPTALIPQLFVTQRYWLGGQTQPSPPHRALFPFPFLCFFFFFNIKNWLPSPVSLLQRMSACKVIFVHVGPTCRREDLLTLGCHRAERRESTRLQGRYSKTLAGIQVFSAWWPQWGCTHC